MLANFAQIRKDINASKVVDRTYSPFLPNRSSGCIAACCVHELLPIVLLLHLITPPVMSRPLKLPTATQEVLGSWHHLLCLEQKKSQKV